MVKKNKAGFIVQLVIYLLGITWYGISAYINIDFFIHFRDAMIYADDGGKYSYCSGLLNTVSNVFILLILLAALIFLFVKKLNAVHISMYLIICVLDIISTIISFTLQAVILKPDFSDLLKTFVFSPGTFIRIFSVLAVVFVILYFYKNKNWSKIAASVSIAILMLLEVIIYILNINGFSDETKSALGAIRYFQVALPHIVPLISLALTLVQLFINKPEVKAAIQQGYVPAANYTPYQQVPQQNTAPVQPAVNYQRPSPTYNQPVQNTAQATYTQTQPVFTAAPAQTPAQPQVSRPAADTPQTPTAQTKSISSADADLLIQYKKLLDMNIISQEEFDKMKNGILSK